MAIAIEDAKAAPVHRVDLSVPVLVLLGLFLCGLVLLPLGWLVWYSITDNSGGLTLGNFARLASDPTFAAPYLTAIEIALAGSWPNVVYQGAASAIPTIPCRAIACV